MKTEFYVTTFCNFAHNTKTGRPIGHECYILPPDAIKAERDGDTDKAIEILRTKGKGPIVVGRKLRTGLGLPKELQTYRNSRGDNSPSE